MKAKADWSNDDLVSAAQNGEHDAFDELFLRVQSDLFKVAFRITRNEAEAEEATQNALLQIFRKIDHFRGDAQFTTWAHRIAATSALQILRRKRRRPQTIEMESLHPGATEEALEQQHGAAVPDASRVLELRQLVGAITDGIEQLSATDREIMQLYVFEDETVESVADRLGLTVPAVKSRLHRARKRVRADVAYLAG